MTGLKPFPWQATIRRDEEWKYEALQLLGFLVSIKELIPHLDLDLVQFKFEYLSNVKLWNTVKAPCTVMTYFCIAFERWEHTFIIDDNA